ncbi:putative Ribosomal protein S16 [Seiridium unicorne]|uniref:Ribosomal protein S16 n=1 Tax=Seiridium unicorne TaxID=138068 RepID=A0ABR2UX07_9PEZI
MYHWHSAYGIGARDSFVLNKSLLDPFHNTMTLKIRLARFGRRNAPFYNIVVAHARTARNSKPLEVIGTYDPIPKADPYDDSGRLHKDIKLDILRAKYWIGVGAQPTDTMWRLMSMVGILNPKHRAQEPRTAPPLPESIAGKKESTKAASTA